MPDGIWDSKDGLSFTIEREEGLRKIQIEGWYCLGDWFARMINSAKRLSEVYIVTKIGLCFYNYRPCRFACGVCFNPDC